MGSGDDEDKEGFEDLNDDWLNMDHEELVKRFLDLDNQTPASIVTPVTDGELKCFDLLVTG